MKVLADQFKSAVRDVRAAGRGGQHDEQCVIVRAEPGRLVLVGIGTEQKPGTEASCPLNYAGDTVAVMTSLVGLRWLAGVLLASDEVDLTVEEAHGVAINITSWKNHGRDATLRVTSRLEPRKVTGR